MFIKNTLIASGLLATLGAAAPCDIYAAGNTPCVAAHSTTRSLYDRYGGALYQVQRNSDGAKRDIIPRTPGGVADGIDQDRFCFRTTCLITVIYDQSGSNNHLTRAPPGGFQGPDVGGYDNLASAIGAPVKLNGQLAYGVFISPGTGYRINDVNGTAVGDEPQGMYAIFDGTHYNGACCFDYGNAETNNLDTGNGHMEAIYFGTSTDWGSGSGPGPWLMADLENGIFSGANPKVNPENPTIKARFFSAMVKGKPGRWALRGGDATVAGPLTTIYDGRRPDAEGYDPMSKEGAIVLGIGGDNSNGAQGTFYEGVMTSGYPTDAVENAVQADIRAARYTEARSGSGATWAVNDTVSFRATTPGFTDRYLAHNGNQVVTQVVGPSAEVAIRKQASWIVHAGLGYSGCYSFEAADKPGSFVRHFDFGLRVDANDGSKSFKEDATFCRYSALSGSGSSLRSWSYPTRWVRHFDNVGYIASQGGVRFFDNAYSFSNDVSWTVLKSLA